MAYGYADAKIDLENFIVYSDSYRVEDIPLKLIDLLREAQDVISLYTPKDLIDFRAVLGADISKFVIYEKSQRGLDDLLAVCSDCDDRQRDINFDSLQCAYEVLTALMEIDRVAPLREIYDILGRISDRQDSQA